MGKRTGRITAVASFVAAVVLCSGATAAQAASVTIGSIRGGPGTQVTFPIKMTPSGANVAGTQNDVTFNSANTPIATKKTCSVTQSQTCTDNSQCPAGGTGGIPPAETCVDRPDCTVSGSINKQVYLSFQPSGCSGAACTAIRVIVVKVVPDSTDPTKPTADSLDPIPGGATGTATLATCKARNNSSAIPPLGQEYALASSAPILSDPTGTALSGVTATDGMIVSGCIGGASNLDFLNSSDGQTGFLGFVNGDPTLNPAADANFDGIVDSSEGQIVFLNFVNGTCN